MSKSLGNFYTLRDLVNEGYHPEAFVICWLRCPTAQVELHLRRPEGGETAIDRLRIFVLRLETEKLAEGIDDRSQREQRRRSSDSKPHGRRSEHGRSPRRGVRVYSRDQQAPWIPVSSWPATWLPLKTFWPRLTASLQVLAALRAKDRRFEQRRNSGAGG